MQQRIKVHEVEPAAFAAMMGLEKYTRQTALDPHYKELIKIRASQLNGCAYCLAMHTEEARQMGETERRIYAISAWWESPLFSEEEKVLFKLTEELTLMHSSRGISEATYTEAQSFFDDHTLAHIIMQIITINAWNRAAVASHAVYEYKD